MTRIKDIDRGWKKHRTMMRRQSITEPSVNIGIVGPDSSAAHTGTELTVIEVASYHEFGRGNNPERSFIRGSYDANLGNHKALLRMLADKVLAGKMSHKKALALFGEQAAADMKNFMRAGIEPEKADGGIARLKDTGQLYGSIAYEVKGV